jgi:hypothetical protein
MPVLAIVTFVVVAVIWLAMLVTVVSEGFGAGMHLWIRLFVLIGFALVATCSYLRIRGARGDVD